MKNRMLSTNAVVYHNNNYDNEHDYDDGNNNNNPTVPIFQPAIEEEAIDDDDDDVLQDDDDKNSVDELMDNDTETYNNNINDERNQQHHHHNPFISPPPKYDNPIPVYEQAPVTAAAAESTSTSTVPLSFSTQLPIPATPTTRSPSVTTTTATTTATIGKSNNRHHPYKLPSSRDMNTNKKKKNNNSNNSNNNNNISSSALPHGDFKGGQTAWQAMLYELMVYRANNENNINKLTCTTYDSTNNTKEQQQHTHTLYLWLQNQKKHYKRYMENKPSFLNQDRIKILESIGIEWNIRGNIFWDRMYEKLKAYKIKHGDCLVPRTWKEDKRLGEWVTDQRRQYKYKQTNKATMLSDERERKLNEIGFAWSLRNRMDWNIRFEQLVEFKQEYGHCIVPQLYNKEKGLGKWVSKQREQYKNMQDGKYSFMTKDRIKQLDALGFSWNAKGRRSAESLMGCDVLKLTTTTKEAAAAATTATITTAGAGVDQNETNVDIGNTDIANDENEHHTSVRSPFKDTTETLEKDHSTITYAM